jgi:hypothetical protein
VDVQHNRSTRRGKRVHVFGKERNEGRLRQHGEALRRHGTQHGGLLIENEKRTFARARRFHYSGQHAARCFGEFALGRELRPEIGESFNRAQQPRKLLVSTPQTKWSRTLSRMSVTRGNMRRAERLVG